MLAKFKLGTDTIHLNSDQWSAYDDANITRVQSCWQSTRARNMFGGFGHESQVVTQCITIDSKDAHKKRVGVVYYLFSFWRLIKCMEVNRGIT